MTSSPSQGLSNGIRSYAVPVRCIKVGVAMPVPVSSVQLDAAALQLVEGETHLLTATITARLGSLSATCTVTVQNPGSGSDIEDMNPDDWN